MKIVINDFTTKKDSLKIIIEKAKEEIAKTRKFQWALIKELVVSRQGFVKSHQGVLIDNSHVLEFLKYATKSFEEFDKSFFAANLQDAILYASVVIDRYIDFTADAQEFLHELLKTNNYFYASVDSDETGTRFEFADIAFEIPFCTKSKYTGERRLAVLPAANEPELVMKF